MAAKKNPKINLPKGFVPISLERVDGWFALEKGNTIIGVLEDIFQTNSRFHESGKKNVFKVRITEGETKVTLQKDETTTLSEGALIGVDEKGFLKSLAKVAHGSVIFIRVKGKSPPSKEYPQGNWDFDVGVYSHDPD